MHTRRLRRTDRQLPLLENLEPRTLLSAAILQVHVPHLLNAPSGSDLSVTVGGFTLPANAFATLHAVIAWDDGSITFGNFTGHIDTSGSPSTNAQGAFDVYLAGGTHTLGLHTASVFVYQTGAGGKIINHLLYKTAAYIDQNSDEGLTVNGTAGQSFSGKVATLNLQLPDSYSGQLGNFFLPGPDSIHGSDIAVSIAWGDGTSSIATITKNDQGTWDISGDHTYAMAGNYRITVTASGHDAISPTAPPGQYVSLNLGMLLDSAQSSATITSSASSLHPFSVVNTPFSIVLGHLSALPVGDLFIHWGDGSMSRATFQADNGGFDVVGAHTYHQTGNHLIEVGGDTVPNVGFFVHDFTADTQATATILAKGDLSIGIPLSPVVPPSDSGLVFYPG